MIRLHTFLGNAMIAYLLIMLMALFLAWSLVPIARRVARHTDMVDQPNARKIHTTPTPLLGGVAIYVAFMGALLLLAGKFYISQVVGIFLGATLVSFLGLWDDRFSLSPAVKLLGQVIAGLILIATGVQVLLFHSWLLNWALTLFWVVGLTNAMNLLDNMDGLSSGVALIASSTFVLLAAGSDQYLVGALAAALVGASAGFLFYNFNPASIFMGDSGSLFLGFMLAAVGIKLRFPTNVPTVTWMIPPIVLGVPLFDTTLVVISRLRRGLNPLTTPGKDHFSHRLVRLGYTKREAVLLIYLLTGALGEIALFMTHAGWGESYLIGGLVLLAAIWGIWRLEQVPLH